mgnify:CR=1 FL=1
MTQLVIGKQATAASFEADRMRNAYVYIGNNPYTKLPDQLLRAKKN